eukprot:6658861-Prymnesium_polylepis.1
MSLVLAKSDGSVMPPSTIPSATAARGGGEWRHPLSARARVAQKRTARQAPGAAPARWASAASGVRELGASIAAASRRAVPIGCGSRASDLGVDIHREEREVDRVRLRRRQVEELAERRQVRHLVHHLHELHVRRVVGKVALEHDVDLGLEDEAVVDGVHLDVVAQVPARLPAPRLRIVHDVVHHEEHCLQPLDTPAEHCGAAELGRGEAAAAQAAQRVDDRQAARQLAVRHVVIHHVLDVLGGARRERVRRD